VAFFLKEFCSAFKPETSYESNTRDFYKDTEVAKSYHDSLHRNRLLSLRFRLIADREIQIITSMLKKHSPKTVLDLPCGTGKLGPLFKKMGAKVHACDVSEEMLHYAKLTYEKINYTDVEFGIGDAEKFTETNDQTFDVALCIRLLHRVPTDIKRNMLREFSKLAPFSIVSMAIDTPYHRIRRRFRKRILGGGGAFCYVERAEAETLIQEFFEIEEMQWVLPYASQEAIYRLKSKDC